MRVLVTGGTGFIGERLVQKLIARGDDVVVLSRRAGKSKNGATLAQWTPLEAGPWLEEVDKADAIVHLAGAGILDKRWTKEHLAMCRESRTVPTALIAERLAARRAHPAKALVSASAVGYYGYRTDDAVCDESLSPGDDVIARLVADWEGACAAIENVGTTRVVRARIGVVLGPEGGALKQMLPAFRFGIGGPLGSGNQVLPWVSAEDTVNALVFLLDTPTIEGPVNVTAPNLITMGQFAKALGDVLHRPAFFRVPSFALRIIMGDGADVVLTGQNALPTKLLAAGFAFETPAIEPALKNALLSAPG